MQSHDKDIIIIGAGMAGLSCASALSRAGYSVLVLDKGRGPGGRMAARRTQIAGETVSFDHGAQFFTARDAGFQQAVAEWETTGAAARWPAADTSRSGEAWVGVPGMNGPIKAMAAANEVLWNTRALTLTRGAQDSGWVVDIGDQVLSAKTLLIAVPAEQAGELMHEAAPDLAAVPAGIISQPCWAVMAGFSDPLGLMDDIVRGESAPIAWAARNSAKPGRSGQECWVLHAAPQRSREIIDMDKEEAAKILLADFFEQTGIDPQTPIHLAAHRWLYAQPETGRGARSRGVPAIFDAQARIGLAGDYLHSPRVEGAWISGAALAQLVMAAAR